MFPLVWTVAITFFLKQGYNRAQFRCPMRKYLRRCSADQMVIIIVLTGITQEDVG